MVSTSRYAYGSHYGVSKWAAEQVLHSAHNRFGLPVNIYRCNMILAHRQYRGQINIPDIFTRLIYSIVKTGLAPRSFYKSTPERRSEPHYDGLPVDFIASAIFGMSAEVHDQLRTFHVVNYHEDDGVSLDTIVDWIQSEGFSVDRVDDYQEWAQRFGARLEGLSDEERQRSSFGVLNSLSNPYDSDGRLPGCSRFRDALHSLPIGPEAPHLTQGFVAKCLMDLGVHDLIPRPTQRHLIRFRSTCERTNSPWPSGARHPRWRRGKSEPLRSVDCHLMWTWARL